MSQYPIPPANERISDPDGTVTHAWGRYFQDVSKRFLELQTAWSTLATSPSYANDAAAAAGGVLVGHLYRTGSHVVVRVT